VAAERARAAQRRFEDELRVEEMNSAEPGEAEAARKLRQLWGRYLERFRRFQSTPAVDQEEYYFRELLPGFISLKDAADVILDMNQDAIVQKSAPADRSTELWSR